ncbi:MAG: SPOR domain-containing protein [Flavobacteriales bacterium]
MNKTVVKHISNLLYDHDCVIITNFGAFVCNHTSAKLDDVTGILSPPGKSILFNSQLKENDGLLINHISQKENISLDDAQIELAKFVEDCKKNLSQFKSLRFDKIGLLTLNDENKIIFSQDSNINYNKNSFGLQDLVNNKISRDHAEVVEESLKIIKSKKTFNSKRILKAAAILIPLIGISLLSITQEKAVNQVYNQIAELNPLSIFKSEKKEIPVSNIIIKEVKKEIEKPSVVIEKEQVSKKQYYIIAGAFSIEANANKLQSRLNKWNYNSTVIRGENIMRVSYDEFKSKEEALISLAKIRKENPQAWILTI